MKQFLSLFLIFFFPSLISFGQPLQDLVKVEISPEDKKSRDLSFFYTEPLGFDNKGAYTLIMPPSEYMSTSGIVLGVSDQYSIARISPNMTDIILEPITLKEEDKEKTFEFTIWFNDQIYLFSSFQNQKLKKTFLFAQTIDKLTLKENPNLQKIAEIDYSLFDKFKYSNFNYSLSPDKSMLLIHYSLLNKFDETLEFGLMVLNKKFSTVWEHKGSFPGIDKGIFSFKEYSVSNNGDVYILGQVFENEKEYSKNAVYKKVIPLPFFGGDLRLTIKPNYKYKVISFWDNGKLIKDSELKLQGMFIRDLMMVPTGKNKLVCAGLYSKPYTMSALGTCIFKIDRKVETGPVADFTPFGMDFLTKGMNEKEISKLKKNLDAGKEFEKELYYLKPLELSADGGFWLMAEKVDHRKVTTNNGHTITINHVYYNTDISVAKYNADGKLSWTQKVNKKQYTANQGYLLASFKVHHDKNSLFLIFTEISKKDYGMFKVKRSSSSISKIDEKGNEESYKFVNNEGTGIILRPEGSCYLSPNTILVPGTNGMAKYQFVKLDIKN